MLRINAITPEERHAVIDKALADGHFAIASMTGVMVVANKELAALLFATISQRLADADEGQIATVFVATDDRQKPCIAVGQETNLAVVLYGLEPGECVRLMKQTGLGETLN